MIWCIKSLIDGSLQNHRFLKPKLELLKIDKIIDAIGEGTIKPCLAKERLSKLESGRDYIQSEIDRVKQKHLVGLKTDDRIVQIIRNHML